MNYKQKYLDTRKQLLLEQARRFNTGIQATIHDSVARRGYLAGRTPNDIVKQQVLKAIEELGEVARHVFDGHNPPVSELADVVIPMLIAAHELGEDLLAEAERKAAADVTRGVR